MTIPQLTWHEYQEKQRSNLAQEKETNRSNLVREGETRRHNLVTEGEENRSNMAREKETNRANLVNERINQQTADAKTKDAVTNAKNARTNAKNAKSNATQAKASILAAKARDKASNAALSQAQTAAKNAAETATHNRNTEREAALTRLTNKALKEIDQDLSRLNMAISENNARASLSELETYHNGLLALDTSKLTETQRNNLVKEQQQAYGNIISYLTSTNKNDKEAQKLKQDYEIASKNAKTAAKNSSTNALKVWLDFGAGLIKNAGQIAAALQN